MDEGLTGPSCSSRCLRTLDNRTPLRACSVIASWNHSGELAGMLMHVMQGDSGKKRDKSDSLPTTWWLIPMFVGCGSVFSMFIMDTLMLFMCLTCGLLLHPLQDVFLHQPGLRVCLDPIYHSALTRIFQQRPPVHGPLGLRAPCRNCQDLPRLQPRHLLLLQQEFQEGVVPPALHFPAGAGRKRSGHWLQRGGTEPSSRRHPVTR